MKNFRNAIRNGLVGLVLTGVSMVPLSNVNAQQTRCGRDDNECGVVLCTEWNDINKNGHGDWGEFKGIKSEYGRSEYILSFFHICPNHNSNGNVGRVVSALDNDAVIDKKINSVQSTTKANTSHWGSARLKLPEIYRQCGPGNYIVKYNVNGKEWQSRVFRLIDDGTSVHPFVCNHIMERKDSNSMSEEDILGKGKERLRKTEKITWCLETEWHIGEEIKMVLVNPKGDDVYEQHSKAKHKLNISRFSEPSHERFIEKGGYGTYSALFYLNNKRVGKVSYEVTE